MTDVASTKATPRQLTLAQILDLFTEGTVRFRFTGYDGSSAGPEDAPIAFHLNNSRGAAYLLTAPSTLGMARAYVAGDLEVSGVHPGDPYDALCVIAESLHWRRPHPRDLRRVTESLGLRTLIPPPPPPPQEAA
ncbi:MAG: SAM-dependent methyltransferase, partial [Nocardioidaceae bacterium]